MTKLKPWQGSLMWALVGAVLFIPFLGGVHLFDWDEINFAEISREMIATGDYLRVYIDYEPFFQKPPLFFWFQVLSMKTFGVNEFAARFPNAVCGIITLVLLFNLGRSLYDDYFGHLWALIYVGTVLPFLYFKSGIIDPYFNLFIFLGLYYIILYYWKKEQFSMPLRYSKWAYLLLSGLFLGLGILTKGPVAFLLASLTMFVYWIYQRFRFYITVPAYLLLTFVAFLLTVAWFGIETLLNGPEFVQAFIAYNIELATTESAGHGGFPGYHFVVMLLGCFPASIFAIRAFGKLKPAGKDFQNDFRIWMKHLFWVVIILFSIVESKIVHYSSLCYFPLTFLAALVIKQLLLKEISYKRWMNTLLIIGASLYILIILAIPLAAPYLVQIKDQIADPFAQANLEASVNWTGWEVLPAVLLIGILGGYLWRIKSGPNQSAFNWLFGGTAIFVLMTLIFFIKRVEGYTQRANLEFFKSLQGEKAYVYTYGYKSYAHLYYSDKAPDTDAAIRTIDPKERQEWLMNGKIDRPVYFSVRIHRAERLRSLPQFEELYAKNGFVFLKRVPDSSLQ
ncbi:MAG: glycosyltransferase family 39 protein [Bacteroidota bacterium]